MKLSSEPDGLTEEQRALQFRNLRVKFTKAQIFRDQVLGLNDTDKRRAECATIFTFFEANLTYLEYPLVDLNLSDMASIPEEADQMLQRLQAMIDDPNSAGQSDQVKMI